jgi:hypothetical protein
MIVDLQSVSVAALLDLYVGVGNELKRRGITRSTNNPVADLGEFLCTRGLSLQLTSKSTKGHDATDGQGLRYEIKARRLTADNPSRELSAIRAFESNSFDLLAGVLFRENFTLFKACLIPRDIVARHACFVKHTNALKFLLRDELWSVPGVVDITRQLQQAEAAMRG